MHFTAQQLYEGTSLSRQTVARYVEKLGLNPKKLTKADILSIKDAMLLNPKGRMDYKVASAFTVKEFLDSHPTGARPHTVRRGGKPHRKVNGTPITPAVQPIPEEIVLRNRVARLENRVQKMEETQQRFFTRLEDMVQKMISNQASDAQTASKLVFIDKELGNLTSGLETVAKKVEEVKRRDVGVGHRERLFMAVISHLILNSSPGKKDA